VAIKSYLELKKELQISLLKKLLHPVIKILKTDDLQPK